MISRAVGVMAHWRETMSEFALKRLALFPLPLPSFLSLISNGNDMLTFGFSPRAAQPLKLWRPQQVYVGGEDMK